MKNTDCLGCGRTQAPGMPQPTMCDHCPPVICGDCGQMMSLSNLCRCWISVENIAMADAKALFSRDGTFNIAPDGTLTIAMQAEGGRK